MTRHVSEADTLPQRTVRRARFAAQRLHWGDGAKEARIAESYTKRFVYYLTADELIGD